MRMLACLLVAFATLTACKSAPAVRGHSLTLALDNTTHGHLRMATGRVVFREDGGEPEVSLIIKQKAGAPVDAAIDPGFGVGAIAYERALYCVDAQVVPPAPVMCEPPAFAIRRIAIVGRRLIATGATRLAMYEARDVGDEMQWVLVESCFKPRRMQRIDLAIPWQENDYTAVGIVDGAPAVVRVSRRDGPWRMGDPCMLQDLSDIAAVRSLGERLIVFGRKIRTSSVAAQGPPTMTVEILGFTIDTDRLVSRPTMQMKGVDRASIEVTDLALSREHAVVVVDGTLIQTYAITGDGLQWAPGKAPEVSRKVDIEWVGGNLFHQYVEGSSEPKLLPLQPLDP